MNIPVVQEKGIREWTQAFERVLVIRGDGFFAEVAAGHYKDRRGGFAVEDGVASIEDQMVERGVGQHDTERIHARGEVVGQGGSFPFIQEDDGLLPAGEQFSFRFVHFAMTPDHFEVRRHQCERFALPAFSPPQFIDRHPVSRVAGKMKTADPFDGDDLSLPQVFSCFQDCGEAQIYCRQVLRLRRRDFEMNTRSALRTSHRLGMEAAVRRIGIFGSAFRAHFELRHGGGGAVVRQVGDDRKTRTAIRAVDERIKIAPVFWVEEFAFAVRAEGNIR